ncbi:D-3-phosphoglycerate dehydrogenase [Candidatus Nitrosotalea sp. FS]|nr:D-3-phosphoglycerate dehydrogenase [Candidatus Nitrosotalea sp. FS]
MLSSADYISFHVPLTETTHHLVNSKRISTMKKTAYIINTSRGEIIDEDALYNALKEGKIAGAALDVFEKEPAVGNKLTTLPNVVCTPHIGAQTKEAQTLAANVIGEKIIMILRGVI